MNFVEAHRGHEFTLPELISAAEELLGAFVDGSSDRRVSVVPDIRTLRFYQTSGLLAKPLRYDGRRATYGYHHLLQIVCIKRLQSEGYPLSMIHRALTGRTERELEEKLGQLLSAALPARPVELVSPPPSPEPFAVRARIDPSAPRYRTLLSADIAPGLTLTMDPNRFEESERLFSEMTSVLVELMEKKS